MTKKEIEVLAQACRAAEVDTTKIKPENPFEKSGATATFIQGAVEQIDPVMAAKWRVAAAGPPDLEQQATAGGDGAGSAGRRIIVNAG